MIGKIRRTLWRKANPVKLIVHIGLHKTASTYLQHLLNDNCERLMERGVYYKRQGGYPAHHKLAWQLLRGESEPLARLIDEARYARCNTLIVSSEDLEAIFFDERPLEAIKRAARTARATEVEFHVVLRDPGRAFSSLFRELAKHTYADPLMLFHSVMQRGFIHMVEPGSGVPYWYYSFDHARDLALLATRSGSKVVAHDFMDAEPFPGWRMIADHLSAISAQPANDARNASNPDDVTTALLKGHLDKIGVDRVVNISDIDEFGEVVSAKFGASHHTALETYGQAAAAFS